MANNAISVQNYRFRKTDDLFLDADIWLFIYGPPQNRYKTDVYEDGGADFNDQVIRELCRSQGLKLITDDGDFNSQGIAVLIANQRLLR